jgi:hypothetical protein
MSVIPAPDPQVLRLLGLTPRTADAPVRTPSTESNAEVDAREAEEKEPPRVSKTRPTR